MTFDGQMRRFTASVRVITKPLPVCAVRRQNAVFNLVIESPGTKQSGFRHSNEQRALPDQTRHWQLARLLNDARKEPLDRRDDFTRLRFARQLSLLVVNQVCHSYKTKAKLRQRPHLPCSSFRPFRARLRYNRCRMRRKPGLPERLNNNPQRRRIVHGCVRIGCIEIVLKHPPLFLLLS